MGTLTMPSTDETKQLLGYLSSVNSLKRVEQQHMNLLHKLEKDVYADKDMITFHKKQLQELQDQVDVEMKKIEQRLIEL
jgi:predicted  nucleic acid-binding Zn-ribbon protein